MFIGSRQDVDHLGYVMGRCPKCGSEGLFTVYAATRKLTAFIVAALPVGQQHLLECRSCGVRFALPPERVAELEKRLISADKMADLAARSPGADPDSPDRPTRTLYSILQVDPDADPDVIEAAFKRLALKFHPDRNPGENAADRMREMIAARDVLADPRKRTAYDRSIGIVRQPVRPPAMRADEV